MTVPQYHLPSTVFFLRIRTVLTLRPSFLRYGGAFCGTAIAVPYINTERKKGPGFRRGAFQTVEEVRIRNCRGRRPRRPGGRTLRF